MKPLLITMIVVWITAITSYYSNNLFFALMIPLGFTIGFLVTKFQRNKK